MATLSYQASPALGFRKALPLFLILLVSGVLSFLWMPFALIAFILMFPWAYLVYRYTRTTYQLSDEQLTVSRGRLEQRIDLSDIVSFRVEAPLWLSFFYAERMYCRNAEGKEVTIYLFDHQLKKIIAQLPTLDR